jgi:hypothetical protein
MRGKRDSFERNDKMRKKTHTEFVSQVNNVNLNIKILGEYTKSNETIAVKCLKCNGEWNPIAHSLIENRGCPYCCPAPRKILIGFNDMWTTNPNLANLLLNPEDGYKYTQHSEEKVDWKCNCCGNIIKNKKISDYCSKGISCSKCSDGKSYPNKFCFNLLDQLQKLHIIKDFETEKIFDWLKYKFKGKLRQGRLDDYFELNGKKYGIEMDGGFHNKNNNLSGQTKEESQYIDDEKDKLCRDNFIEVIRIDSKESELEFIKNSIMQSELPKLLNFQEEDIDWLKCHEYACSSLVKVVCDLWNSGIKNINEITKSTKLSRDTIRKYLKQGSILNWCDYNAEKERIKNLKNMQIKSIKSISKRVLCIETGVTYNSISEAKRNVIKGSSHIADCCEGRQKTCGKLEDGTKLHWEYVL